MTSQLIALRLHWYADATALLLRRRWQVLLIILGLLGVSVLLESAHLVLALLDQRHGLFWHLVLLWLWQGLSVLWVLMQLDQLRGGRFRDLVQSLPLSSRQWRLADLSVLLVSDTPLFLPLVAAAFALATQPGFSADILNGSLIMIFLLATLLACQLSVLNHRSWDLVSVVLADIWVVYALAQPGLVSSIMLGLAAACGVWSLVFGIPVLLPTAVTIRLERVQHYLPLLLQRLLSSLSPQHRLSWGILYVQHQTIMFGKLISCLLMVLLCMELMSVWQYDSRSLPMVLIAVGLIALNISSLFRYLHRAHDKARAFTAALPLSARWALPGDTLAVLSFALPFVVILAMALWSRTELSTIGAIGLVASSVLLLMLLRWVQLYSNRHSVLGTLLVTGLWVLMMVVGLQS